ncbi:MAG: DNA-directed RNA polymerase subunit M [Candidatus Thorarchaeota archaeon]|nr:DNA-directed RNA polymerase subunit M [Candidatus Thorarchaeota archaeon]
MEFCEKCGALMLPEKKDKKNVLKCRECGHEKPMKNDGYKVEFRVKHSPKEKIVVVEEEDRKDSELTEDERRERRKAILEFYDGDE